MFCQHTFWPDSVPGFVSIPFGLRVFQVLVSIPFGLRVFQVFVSITFCLIVFQVFVSIPFGLLVFQVLVRIPLELVEPVTFDTFFFRKQKHSLFKNARSFSSDRNLTQRERGREWVLIE